MPTSIAELSITIEAHDRASAQLRQVGQAVDRLEKQVEGVQRRGGGLLTGLNVGAGIAAAQQAFSALGGVLDFIKDSVVTLNSELERNVATFEAVTGSAQAAADVVAALRREAAVSPFSDREILQAGRTLIAVSERSTESLLGLVRVAEILAAMDPAQGLEGAGVALREALSGDFESLVRRFEFSREAIARWRAQGISNLEIVRRELERLGYTSELVERLGRTFEGRAATIRSFFDELRQRAGAGVFDRLSDLFGRMVEVIDAFGDRLRVLATGVGTALGAIAQRIGEALTGPLRALSEALAPGLWDELVAAMERVPPVLEQQGRAAQGAAEAVQDQTRRLAELGVEAAGLQIEADRVRRSYDDQIQPLERQLRLLQQSADLQRVQNALASNQGAVERLRLERETLALRRAAGGATDPNAEGLTLRQRLIALALQEKELRQEELTLEEERRPLVQTLQQQIAAIQEEQRKALEPLERSLALRKDEVDAITLVRKQEELLGLDIAANAKTRMEGWTSKNPGALDEVKQRGEELAASWLQGWAEWIEKGGGTVWGAVLKSLNDWWEATGRPAAIRVGAELGVAIGAAAGVALQAVLGPELERLRALEEHLAGLQQRVQATQAVATQVAENVAAGAAVTANTRETAAFGPGGLPLVREPRGGAGGQVTNVTVEAGAVRVEGGGADAESLRRARDETIKAVTAAFAQAEAQTDPGAPATVQGTGR